MPSSGAAFYDERDVFEVYASGVAPGPWTANHVMEEPAFLRLLGEVSGLRVLDLGCGTHGSAGGSSQMDAAGTPVSIARRR